MSMVSESNPWCDITSAENALGMDSQPFTTASPFAQISFSLLARTSDSSHARARSFRPGGIAHYTPMERGPGGGGVRPPRGGGGRASAPVAASSDRVDQAVLERRMGIEDPSP